MKEYPLNIKAEIEYARRWAFSANPAYYNFENIGGDCTNFVSQGVLLLLQEIIHSFARCYIRQKPQRMRQNIQQSCVGIRHRRTLVLSELQVVDTGGKICTSHQIKPLLDLVFIYKMCFRTLAFCGEKYIEVKHVELSLLCDLADTFGYLIGHKNHSRQRKIGIAQTFPLMLGTLFVGVCPVIDLILDELAAVYCTERCTRQEQVMSRSYGEKALVVGIL